MIRFLGEIGTYGITHERKKGIFLHDIGEMILTGCTDKNV